MKIHFIKSPTGFKLAYNVGDEANIKDELAKELIELKFARPVEKTRKKRETATASTANKESR